MCSISGVTRGYGASLRKMMSLQKHRAPDDGAIYQDEWVKLGMGRLKILDLESKGLCLLQHGSFIMAWNGEIYNWQELRKDLEQLDVKFETQNDGEVLLKAWEVWGEKTLDKIDGMFAIAIYDRHEKTITLIRDAAGEKPIYYCHSKGRLTFASELKAIVKTGRYGFDPSPELAGLEHCFEDTLFAGVKALLPGHILRYEIETDILSVSEWWKPKFIEIKDPELELEALLEEAIKLRFMADVPVGLYLSGGIDSALIASFVQPKYAFHASSGEDEETLCARATADKYKIPLVNVPLESSAFKSLLPEIAYHLDTPIGSFSSFPLYQLASCAKKKGVKVVISGEGADELFGGYSRYLLPYWEDKALKRPFLSKYEALGRRYYGTNLERYCRLTARSTGNIANVVQKVWRETNSLDDFMWADFRLILPSLLQMGDRMASAFGIENRCPFLGRKLLDFAFSLPLQWKIKQGTPKYLLRQIARKRGVPDMVLQRNTKQGLIIPFANWFGQEGSQYDRKKYLDLLMFEWKKAYL